MAVDRPGLHRFAHAHHGVIGKAEARAFGVSASLWYAWIRTGELEPMHPGVATLAGTPATFEARVRAGVLACPPGAVASHRSAAALHGCWPSELGPVPVELTVGRGGPRALGGIVLHRPKDGWAIRPVICSTTPTTDPARTLGDLGQVVSADELTTIVFSFLRRNLVDVATLRSDAEGRRKPGRVGPDVLLEVLARVSSDDGVIGSELERRVVDALRGTNLPPPKQNHRVMVDGRPMLLDLAWPDYAYSIELDGLRYHAERFEQDRERDVQLRTAGWTVDRFTWKHATTRQQWMLTTIRSRLVERGWQAAA